jgi:hypothetical protein
MLVAALLMWPVIITERYVDVVQTKMPRPKRKKIVEAWIKLHNEELHDLHSSLSIRVIKARGMRWMRHVTGILVNKNTCTVLIWKPQGKTPLQTSRWA